MPPPILTVSGLTILSSVPIMWRKHYRGYEIACRPWSVCLSVCPSVRDV